MEATLNEIIERIGRRHDMLGFLRNPHPGLQDKLAWFYNEYVARKKALTKKQMYRDRIADKIRRKFPGFAGLHRFRNDVAHGLINKDARSLETALTLRQQAKDIVDSFLKITRKAGHDIRPETTYWEAIESHS